MPDESMLIQIHPVHRMALLFLSVVLFMTVLELVRRERLKEKYALLWLGTSGSGVIIGLFPMILEWITSTLHFQLLTTLYTISFMYTLGIILAFSVIISKQVEQNRKLAQEIALLNHRVEKLESKGDGSDD